MIKSIIVQGDSTVTCLTKGESSIEHAALVTFMIMLVQAGGKDESDNDVPNLIP